MKHTKLILILFLFASCSSGLYTPKSHYKGFTSKHRCGAYCASNRSYSKIHPVKN